MMVAFLPSPGPGATPGRTPHPNSGGRAQPSQGPARLLSPWWPLPLVTPMTSVVSHPPNAWFAGTCCSSPAAGHCARLAWMAVEEAGVAGCGRQRRRPGGSSPAPSCCPPSSPAPPAVSGDVLLSLPPAHGRASRIIAHALSEGVSRGCHAPTMPAATEACTASSSLTLDPGLLPSAGSGPCWPGTPGSPSPPAGPAAALPGQMPGPPWAQGPPVGRRGFSSTGVRRGPLAAPGSRVRDAGFWLLWGC